MDRIATTDDRPPTSFWDIGLDVDHPDVYKRVAHQMLIQVVPPRMTSPVSSIIYSDPRRYRNVSRTGVQPDDFVLDKEKVFILDFKYESVMTPKQRVRFGAYKYEQYLRMYGKRRA